jgi:hypothetical protein
MTDLMTDMTAAQKRNTEETNKAYLEIVNRAQGGASRPEDGAMLAEIVKELGLTPQQVASDVAAMKSYLQAKANLDAFDDKAISAGISAAHAELEAENEKLKIAQERFNAVQAKFNAVSSQQNLKHMAADSLQRARERVEHLFNPPVPTPKTIYRSAEVTDGVRQIR